MLCKIAIVLAAVTVLGAAVTVSAGATMVLAPIGLLRGLHLWLLRRLLSPKSACRPAMRAALRFGRPLSRWRRQDASTQKGESGGYRHDQVPDCGTRDLYGHRSRSRRI